MTMQMINAEIAQTKQWVQNQIDQRLLTLAPKDEVKTQVDSLGEEIASDINQIELALKAHEETAMNLETQIQMLHQDLKIAQMQAMNSAK